MVQPPNQPIAANGFNDIQLKASTSDSLQFLASRVGELVEAKVVKVTHQLVNEKAALDAQLGTPPGNKIGNKMDNQPQAKQPMDLTGRNTNALKPSVAELNANRYEVLMNVGGNKTLSVQSPLAPRMGQILQLHVLSSQQLEIVGLRTGSLGELNSSSLQAITPQTAQTQSLKNTAVLMQTTPAKANSNSLAMLYAALRDNLPKQVAKESLTSHLENITRPQPLLNKTVQSAINQLQQSISSVQQVTQPEGLTNAIRHSGLLYEAKLANIIQIARARGIAISNPAITAIAEKLGIQTAVMAHNSKTDNINIPSSYSNIDHKQATLQLITALKDSLFVNSVSRDKPTHPALQNNATLASLWSLVTSALTHGASYKPSGSDSDEQLLQLLRQALNVITRTQGQQLFTANTQLFGNNDNVNNQSWSLDLPIWVDQKLNLIDIQIESNKDSDQQSATEEKAWNARLAFDLEQHGNMVAFVSLRGKTLAAVLWVTEAATVDKVNAELKLMANNLDRLGLQVERLQCRVGEPEDVRPNGTINLLDTEV